jgi:2-polyprenyl-6-methoxyphenol hydroxylase-like FAD-dependent oxidoreductase
LVAQRVAIIGGGIGGLATALALPASDYEIVIVERDPEPPNIDPERAFEAWQRPGVPQFRHAHILLARLQTTLRDEHPALLAELLQAGLQLSTVEQVLPPTHYDGIEPMPGDEDLLHLWGRRPTFEYVVRRYVGRMPHVRFMHSIKVSGLVSDVDGQTFTVRGLELQRGEDKEVLPADLIIDGSGKHSKVPEWLEPHGVRVSVEKQISGFVYSCRHYRLRDPQHEPPRRDGGGNFDYLGYATFYAEHGHFAVTFGCPVEETELAKAIARPDGFEALCAQLPVLRYWTEASEVESKVLGSGRFENRWTRYGTAGGLALAGLFPLGDAQLETNPMYGRGCAAAFVQAGILARALGEKSDPIERARFYYEQSRALLQPYYELSVATDRMYHSRAQLRRGHAIPLPAQLLNYAYERVWLPATRKHPVLAREFLRSMQMREVSSFWLRLVMLWHLTTAFVASWFGGGKAPLAGPPRAEFLRRLQSSTANATNPHGTE